MKRIAVNISLAALLAVLSIPSFAQEEKKEEVQPEQSEEISLDDFLKVDLRVAEIIHAEPVKKADTIKTPVRKIFKANPYKVYPNPVSRGAAVNLELKKESR